MGKQVADWAERLIEVAAEAWGEEPDTRFQSWAKTVTAVSENATNGYAFKGDFIRDGTVELEIRPRVFLAMFANGSRKYQHSYYTIILMDAEGNLTASDIRTDDSKRGWALRIRSDVARLVAEGLAARPQARSRTVTLSGAALEALEELGKAMPETDEGRILELALEELGKVVGLTEYLEDN